MNDFDDDAFYEYSGKHEERERVEEKLNSLSDVALAKYILKRKKSFVGLRINLEDLCRKIIKSGHAKGQQRQFLSSLYLKFNLD